MSTGVWTWDCVCLCLHSRWVFYSQDVKIQLYKLLITINDAGKKSLDSLNLSEVWLSNLHIFLPQEQKVNGVHVSAPTPSSCTFLIGSNSLDREMLKKMGIGLALAAAILAYIVQKLYWNLSVSSSAVQSFLCAKQRNINIFYWQHNGTDRERSNGFTEHLLCKSYWYK